MNFKLSTIQKIIIILLSILLFFMFLNKTIKNDKKIFGSEFITDTIVLTQSVVMAPIRYISDKITEYKELQTFYHEYKILKANLNDYALLKSRNFLLEKENIELRGLLELDSSLLDYEVLNATVIFRDIDNWKDELTINVGESHGVKEGMAVIVPNGLIGKITKVNNLSSVVKLITTTDEGNKISAVINAQGKVVNGVIQEYNPQTREFKLLGIETDVKPSINNLVITSGQGGVYPSALPIGRVTSIGTDEFSLYQVVNIKSEVDFNNLHYVIVVRKEVRNDN